jgi:hypothetical protein
MGRCVRFFLRKFVFVIADNSIDCYVLYGFFQDV